MQIQGLRSGYGGKPVLQGIDLEVGKGEIVAVIGRNGVGKSTLMRLIAGLQTATEGGVWLDGQPPAAARAAARASRTLGRCEASIR